MALTVPLAMFQFSMPSIKLDGDLNAGGFLQFYAAGTTTPEDIFHDVNASASWTNPVELDSSGFAQIWVSPMLYDIVFMDSNSVELFTIEGWGDPGQIVYAGLGTTLAT